MKPSIPYLVAPSQYTRRRVMGLVVGLAIAAGLQADVTDLRITEVKPDTGQVEVTNIGLDAFTAATDLPFSHRNNVSSVIPASTLFAPGESKVFTIPALNAADSDLWLYSDTNFANVGSIISGLKWGPAESVGRTSVAVGASIWPAVNAFVPAQTGTSNSLVLTAYEFRQVEAWGEQAPTLGQYFGTGTEISDPLPPIAKSTIRVDLATVATGLASPVAVVQPDDGSGRLFICDQVGKVYIAEDGGLLPEPMLDLSSRLVTLNVNYDERGLLGLAAHPNFAVNPKIYTLFSEPKGDIPANFPSPVPVAGFNHQGVLAEWTVDPGNPNRIDPASRRELMRIDEPQSNHNGGKLQFGPDGFLYIALGDGGNRDDEGQGHAVGGNAQSLTNVLGKLLRIQVDGTSFANGRYHVPSDNPFVPGEGIDEIWAFGLRNPFSFSFDKDLDFLYLGDVGQGEIEEVNIVMAGDNCGWPIHEGSYFFDPNGSFNGFISTLPVRPLPPDMRGPIAQYDHDDGISIIGGNVYRGNVLPDLRGRYVFGDFGLSFGVPSGRLFSMQNGVINELTISGNDKDLGLWLKALERTKAENYIYVVRRASDPPALRELY